MVSLPSTPQDWAANGFESMAYEADSSAFSGSEGWLEEMKDDLFLSRADPDIPFVRETALTII